MLHVLLYKMAMTSEVVDFNTSKHQ